MAISRVQPLKIEDTTTGGDNNDAFPTGLDRNNDMVDCRGVALQDDISNDETVLLDRSGGDMMFRDQYNTPISLSDLRINIGTDFVKRLLINSTGHVLHDTVGELVLKVGPQNDNFFP